MDLRRAPIANSEMTISVIHDRCIQCPCRSMSVLLQPRHFCSAQRNVVTGQQETHAAQQIRRPKTKRPPRRRPFRNLIRFSNQAAIVAALLRFLPQPNRPIAPRLRRREGGRLAGGWCRRYRQPKHHRRTIRRGLFVLR
jgi:hypothetical protein